MSSWYMRVLLRLEDLPLAVSCGVILALAMALATAHAHYVVI